MIRMSRITRREWAALLGAAPLAAQIVSKDVPPRPAAPAQTIQKAYADVRRISDRLAQIEVPMNVEPAFVFRP
jgi:hypothetical protein